MDTFECKYYYSFCPEDCPFDDTFECPFFASEFEEFYQYSIWELI